MKKWIAAVLAGLMIAGGAQALADSGKWVNSRFNGTIRLDSYAEGFDGYHSVDGCGGITAADPFFAKVISKSATLWSEPRTGSKKVASISNGESVHCMTYDGGQSIEQQNGFYAVEYKGKEGWVNQDYVVTNTLEITLMESNVPAYIAPNVHSKKVGSLSKGTKLQVIGFYDDFYIVELRGAAAYIPMDVRHYDTEFEAYYHTGMMFNVRTTVKTQLRTGPGDDYPVIKDLRADSEYTAMDVIDGYYMVLTDDSNAFAFFDAADGKDAL